MLSRNRTRRGRPLLGLTIAVALASVLCACATSPPAVEFDAATVYGMVYDERHDPVPWAAVSTGENSPVFTDINGRFAIPEVPRGPVAVRVTADGFAPCDEDFLFSARTQVLYIRLSSGESLARNAVSAMEHGDFSAAVRTATEALTVLPNSAMTRFVAAVAAYRSGDVTAARRFLAGFSDAESYAAIALFSVKLESSREDRP